MNEAQKQFEANWSITGEINIPLGDSVKKLCSAYYESAWQHQQQSIEELESKLKIAIDALNGISAQIVKSELYYYARVDLIEAIVKTALKQIEVK